MSGVAVIGRPSDVAGFALAGALVVTARTESEARHAWASLPESVAVVVLTTETAPFLASERERPHAPLTVVMPS